MNAEELIKGLEQYSQEDRLKIIKGLQKDGVKINGLDLNKPAEQALQALQGVKKTGISDGDGLAPKPSGGNESKREALKKMSETQREFMKRTISVMDLSDKLNVMDDTEKIDYLKKLQKEGYSLSSEDIGGKKVSNDWLKDIDLDNPKDFGKVKNQIISAGAKTAQQQFSKGGRKSVGQTVTGLASLAGKGVEKTAGLAGADVDITSGLDKFRDEKLAYKNRGEKIGGTVTDLATLFTGGGAAAKLAGKAEKAASFGQKLKRLGKLSGLEAGATGAYSAAKEGELNSKVAMDAGLAGGLTFGLGSVFGTGKKALGWLSESKDSKNYRNAIKQLEDIGLPEDQLNFIKNLDDAGKKDLTKYVQAGKARMAGDMEAPGAIGKAAEEVNTFFDDLLKKKTELGKEVSAAKNTFLKNNYADTKEVRGTVNEIMSRMGVKFKGGQPDFSDSVLDLDAKAKGIFTDILRKTQKPKVNAMELERITSKIDAGTKILKRGGFDISQFDTAISKAKAAINKSVYKSSPQFAEVDKTYAKFMSAFSPLKSAGKVDVGDGKKIFDAQQILRRSQGDAPSKYKEAIKGASKFKEFGLTPPKDIAKKGYISRIVERATGTTNPASIEGVGESVFKMAARKVPVMGTLMDIADVVKRGKAPVKAAQALEKFATTSAKPKPQPIVNFLKKNLTGAGSRVIIPSAIAGLFAKRD